MGKFQDLVGQRFGRLLVIERDESSKGVRWRTRCDCGKLVNVLAGSLRSNNTKSCGCLHRELAASRAKNVAKNHRNSKFLDLVGKRFGRLQVIARGETIQKNQWAITTWLCKCDCGVTKIIRSQPLRGGLTKSCGCLHRELAGMRAKQIHQLDAGTATRRAVLGTYKAGATKRSLEWGITDTLFYEMLTLPCHYCSSPPSNIRKSRSNNGNCVYQGIDRKDNKQGYIESNVLPCCSTCNQMKGTMIYEQFLTHVSKIKVCRLLSIR